MRLTTRLNSPLLFVALATFFWPASAWPSAGDLYVTGDGDGVVWKFTSTGVKTTFATGLNQPTGLAFDRNGNLFVANKGNGEILKFTPAGEQSVFVSGLSPIALAVDGAGNLLVSESFGDIGTISKLAPDGTKSNFGGGGNFFALALDHSGNVLATGG